MWKWGTLFVVAAATLAAVPDTGEACGRRRCRAAAWPPPCYAPAPCPPVVFLPPCPPSFYYVPAQPFAVAPPGPPAARPEDGYDPGALRRILPTGDVGENDREDLAPTARAIAGTTGIPAADRFAGRAGI